MGLTVFWTQIAEDKLEDIYNYYSIKVSARIAQKLIDEIIAKSLELEINPLMDKKNYSFIIEFRSFVIFYTRTKNLFIE